MPLKSLIDILILAPFTASLSLFVDFCLRDGNIFGFYGNLISNIAERWNWTEYLLKVAGLCVYCLGTWIFICTYLILVKPITSFRLDLFVLLSFGCGINYLLISLFQKVTD